MEYPYKLHRVPGVQALSKLEELRAMGGGVPVIHGDEESFERVVECMQLNNSRTTEHLIEAAGKINAVAWLRERKASEPDYYAIEPGPWPEDGESSNNTLTAHQDVLTREPYAEVFISVIPAAEPWMVPCYLRIGAWNEVPSAEGHAALFKYWSEKYGATVACLAHDVIELTASRPPQTKADALALAKEQYIYCVDIVEQGIGSVEALAAMLLDSTVWYFWWD